MSYVNSVPLWFKGVPKIHYRDSEDAQILDSGYDGDCSSADGP